MQTIRHLWIWGLSHWKSWGIAGVFATASAALTWAIATRKEWNEARKAKSNKTIDVRVMEALEDRSLWTGPRPMTGGGDMAVRADELAAALSLKKEAIWECLERLEAHGRVVNIGGHLADPTPRWHSSRRF